MKVKNNNEGKITRKKRKSKLNRYSNKNENKTKKRTPQYLKNIPVTKPGSRYLK